LKLHFEEAEVEAGAEVLANTMLAFFLINGDFKHLFMMAGRCGCCGRHCLCCQLKQSEWKRLHKEKRVAMLVLRLGPLFH
jgi:hypothetical protein